MQILILGMHRSGTSLVTRLVNMMGVYFGPESSVGALNVNNPKGFWERPEVYRINEELLNCKHCSWEALNNWKPADPPKVGKSVAEDLTKTVRGMDAFRPWVLKDPRLCLVLPAWLPYLEVPIAVVVYRDPVEIALSLQTRDGFPIEYSIALWEAYAIGLLNNTRTMPRIFVQHKDMLQNPVQATASLFQQLVEQGVKRIELPCDREITAFVDPSLYRAKQERNAYTLSASQTALAEMLQGTRPQSDNIALSSESVKILSRPLRTNLFHDPAILSRFFNKLGEA